MLEKQNKSQPKGFTIIEVVLVLAIAGLIFLMVFIALPAMQRSQRDTQRRNDYSMLSTAVTQYSSSNQGRLYRLAGATTADGSASKVTVAAADGTLSGGLDPTTYINDEGVDPNGKTYQLNAYTWAAWQSTCANGVTLADTCEPGESVVNVIIGADCGELGPKGYSVPRSNDSSRAFAIFGYVESGSQTYCSSSQ